MGFIWALVREYHQIFSRFQICINSVKQKRIKNWFYTNNGKNWFLEIRYANKALELAEGKTAIAIQSKDKIVGTIEKVIEAVIGKELDLAISKAVSKRNAKKK